MTQKSCTAQKNAEMRDGQNTPNSKSADPKPLIKRGCPKQSNAAAVGAARSAHLHNARGANCILDFNSNPWASLAFPAFLSQFLTESQ